MYRNKISSYTAGESEILTIYGSVNVEYSPAKEQVEMVTTPPAGSIVAVPKAEAKVHWL
jgi:hypothetical protein